MRIRVFGFGRFELNVDLRELRTQLIDDGVRSDVLAAYERLRRFCEDGLHAFELRLVLARIGLGLTQL